MSNILIKLIPAVIAIAVGSLFIILRERFSRSNIEFQNKWFGFKFSEKDIKSSSWGYAIAGAVFLFLGIKEIIKILAS